MSRCVEASVALIMRQLDRSAHVMLMRDDILEWHAGKVPCHQLSVVVTWPSGSRGPTCCHSCTGGWCGAAGGNLLCANIGPLYEFGESLGYYVDEHRVCLQQYVPKQRTREEQVRHLLKTSWRIDATLVKGDAGFQRQQTSWRRLVKLWWSVCQTCPVHWPCN